MRPPSAGLPRRADPVERAEAERRRHSVALGREVRVDDAEMAALAPRGSRPVAWYPLPLRWLRKHPDGPAWAGFALGYPHLLQLEGRL